ncbi:MAG TPA: DUF3300 domain-containing protein [Geobacteraceae bacterium]|nr:DUF3300 domain-containing protein [Geobacteraceae bacterium]
MRYALWFRSFALYIFLALVLPLPVFSQEDNGDANQTDVQQQRFSQEELAQLLAPIALYPDELLSQVLMASTYPLEVVAADRWVESNKDLKGDELAKALEEKKWDPSVKSLVNFPSVLSMMSQKLEITAKLGDAFLSQETEVMATIQMLRKKAVDAGNLKSSKEQKVVVEQDTVVIEPVEREVVYVPTYDPLVVYGPWMYPAYPPFPFYFWPLYPYGFYAFAPPFYIGFAWGYAWGWCDWHHHSVHVDTQRHHYVNNRYIDRNRYTRNYQRVGAVDRDGQGRWRHDPAHRRGVAYRDTRTAAQFGQSPGTVTRSRDARGFGEVQPRKGGSLTPASRGVSRGEVRGRQAPVGGGAQSAPVVERRGGVDRRGTREAAPSGVRTPAAPKRDSAFSGGYRDSAGARSASERGRSSRGFSPGEGGMRSGGGQRSIAPSGGMQRSIAPSGGGQRSFTPSGGGQRSFTPSGGGQRGGAPSGGRGGPQR